MAEMTYSELLPGDLLAAWKAATGRLVIAVNARQVTYLVLWGQSGGQIIERLYEDSVIYRHHYVYRDGENINK